MDKPKYLPETWMIYDDGAGATMAKIVGAGYQEDSGWTYDVVKPGLEYSDEVKEADVLYVRMEAGNGWRDVNADPLQRIRA